MTSNPQSSAASALGAVQVIAILLVVVLIGGGLAWQQGLLKVPHSPAPPTELERMQADLHTLQQQLESSRAELESVLLQARAEQSPAEQALAHWHLLTEAAIFNGTVLQGLEEIESMVEAWLQQGNEPQAQQALAHLLLGYQQLQADFWLAEQVYSAEQSAWQAREAWQALAAETGVQGEPEAGQALAAYETAQAFGDTGAFKEALESYELAAVQWGLASRQPAHGDFDESADFDESTGFDESAFLAAVDQHLLHLADRAQAQTALLQSRQYMTRYLDDNVLWGKVGRLEHTQAGERCTATLVSNGVALTAAHCLYNAAGEPLQDLSFRPYNRKGEAEERLYRVVEAYLPEKFSFEGSRTSQVFDMAFLRLQSERGAEARPGEREGYLGVWGRKVFPAGPFATLGFSDQEVIPVQYFRDGCHIEATATGELVTECEALPGANGLPVLIYSDQYERYIVHGVLGRNAADSYVASQLTPERQKVFDLIVEQNFSPAEARARGVQESWITLSLQQTR